MNFSNPLRTAFAASVASSPAPKESQDAKLPPGMRRVKTACKACGKTLGIKYPEAVTYWKIQCPSCAQKISIELIGGRKCLVFDVRGRKTVERIGLTDQRRRFFRAKCFSCDETLVVPESEAGRLKSCHKCGLEFMVQEDGEVYYETTVRINEEMTSYREKVQESTGYLANKNTAFFLGEESSKGGKAVNAVEMNAALAAMQREADFLREKEEGLRTEYRQAMSEKEVLARKLAKEIEKVAMLEKASKNLVATDTKLVGMQSQVQKLTLERERLHEEKELLKNKMKVHADVLRALDEEMAKSARLEGKLASLEENVRRVGEARDQKEQEQRILRETLAQGENRLQRAQEALRHSLEERKVLEAKLLALKEVASRQEERVLRGEKATPMAMQGRMRELEMENARLTSKIEEGQRMVKRMQELEREVERLRSVGSVVEPEIGDDWYCEEGEEACIRADSDVGMARRVLGIRGQPTPERIKMALRRRVKRYHPDMVSSLGLDLRDLAHRKMQDINRAYAILMKEYGHA